MLLSFLRSYKIMENYLCMKHKVINAVQRHWIYAFKGVYHMFRIFIAQNPEYLQCFTEIEEDCSRVATMSVENVESVTTKLIADSQAFISTQYND